MLKIIHSNLNEKELTKLALAATDVVHAMDLELPDFSDTKARFLSLLDSLEGKYTNNELLFDARAAILSQPTRKMDIYAITHKLVRMARADRPSAAQRSVSAPIQNHTGIMRHEAFETLSVSSSQH